MQPDRPPGRAEGGPLTLRTRLHNTSTPSPSSAEVVPIVSRGTGSGRDETAMTRAEPLDLSDERDQWQRLAENWARSEYRRGYHDGHGTGYRTGYERAVTQWKITAAGMTHLGGPTYAEQDRRRYPPGGRESWKQPKLGDLYECWSAWSGEADGGDRR